MHIMYANVISMHAFASHGLISTMRLCIWWNSLSASQYRRYMHSPAQHTTKQNALLWLPTWQSDPNDHDKRKSCASKYVHNHPPLLSTKWAIKKQDQRIALPLYSSCLMQAEYSLSLRIDSMRYIACTSLAFVMCAYCMRAFQCIRFKRIQIAYTHIPHP